MLVRGNGCSLPLQTLMPLIALTLQLFASIADRVKQDTMFYAIENAYLTGNVTMVKLATDELDCAFSCLRNDNPVKCFSFNFGRPADRGLHTCELSGSERTLEPHNMQSRKGFDYYGVETEVSYTGLRSQRQLFQLVNMETFGCNAYRVYCSVRWLAVCV